MRSKILLFAACLVSSYAQAQTQKGLHIVASVGAVDFESAPLNSYIREHSQQNINLQAELLYMGGVFGIGATVQSDFDLDSKALVGAKGYLNVVKISKMQTGLALGYQSYIDDFSKQWQLRPEVYLSLPLYGRFDAKLSATGTLFQGKGKMYTGGGFGLLYRL